MPETRDGRTPGATRIARSGSGWQLLLLCLYWNGIGTAHIRLPLHGGRIVQFYLEILSQSTVQEWRCMNHVFLFILYSFPCSGKLQTSRLYIVHAITEHIQCGASKLCFVGSHSPLNEYHINRYKYIELPHTILIVVSKPRLLSCRVPTCEIYG